MRDTPMLRTLLPLPPPQFPTSPLISGQCWTSHTALFPSAEGFIWEYIGLLDPHTANIRVWKTTSPISIGNTARLLTPSCAGGTQTSVPLEELLRGPMNKIILSGDQADRTGVKRSVLSSRPHRTPTADIITTPNHPLLRSILEGNRQEIRSSTFYTDGSCTQRTSLVQTLLGQSSNITSGALAMTVNDTEMDYGTILHATEGHTAGIHTAYGMELAMITIATTLKSIVREESTSPTRIYCDSKPAVHAAHSCSYRKTRKLVSKRMGFLIHQLHRTRDDNISHIRHCYSHPEKRKNHTCLIQLTKATPLPTRRRGQTNIFSIFLALQGTHTQLLNCSKICLCRGNGT